MESKYSRQFSIDQWNELNTMMKNRKFTDMQEFFINNFVWGGNFEYAKEFIRKTNKIILTSYGEEVDIDKRHKENCDYDHYSFNPKWRGGCKRYKPIIEYPEMSFDRYYKVLRPRFIGNYNDSDKKWARDMLASTYPMKIKDDIMKSKNYEDALEKIRLEISSRDKPLLKKLLRSVYPYQADNFIFLRIPKFLGMVDGIDFTGKEIPIDWQSAMIIKKLWRMKIPTSGVITIDGINNIVIGDDISDEILEKLRKFKNKSKYLKIEEGDNFTTILYNPKNLKKISNDLEIKCVSKKDSSMGMIPAII